MGKKYYNQFEKYLIKKGFTEIYGEIVENNYPNYNSEGFWKKMEFIIIKKDSLKWRKIKNKLIKFLDADDEDCDFIYKPIKVKKNSLLNIKNDDISEK